MEESVDSCKACIKYQLERDRMVIIIVVGGGWIRVSKIDVAEVNRDWAMLLRVGVRFVCGALKECKLRNISNPF